MSNPSCDMHLSKSKPVRNDLATDLIEGEVDKDDLADIALQKASAEYYERSWKNRIREHKADLWTVLGLYLIISGIAVVVL